MFDWEGDQQKTFDWESDHFSKKFNWESAIAENLIGLVTIGQMAPEEKLLG